MNKIIFVKKRNLNSINESDFIPEKRKNKLFLDNSDNKIILPLNKSFDEKLANIKKDRDNTKENIAKLDPYLYPVSKDAYSICGGSGKIHNCSVKQNIGNIQKMCFPFIHIL